MLRLLGLLKEDPASTSSKLSSPAQMGARFTRCFVRILLGDGPEVWDSDFSGSGVGSWAGWV